MISPLTDLLSPGGSPACSSSWWAACVFHYLRRTRGPRPSPKETPLSFWNLIFNQFKIFDDPNNIPLAIVLLVY